MDTKQALGRRIKKIRQLRGWTQDEVAEKVGLSPKYISGIERGVENPTIDNLIRLAGVLGAEPYDLFLYGETEESERVLRKALEKMLRELTTEKLQLAFDLFRRISALK